MRPAAAAPPRAGTAPAPGPTPVPPRLLSAPPTPAAPGLSTRPPLTFWGVRGISPQITQIGDSPICTNWGDFPRSPKMSEGAPSLQQARLAGPVVQVAEVRVDVLRAVGDLVVGHEGVLPAVHHHDRPVP